MLCGLAFLMTINDLPDAPGGVRADSDRNGEKVLRTNNQTLPVLKPDNVVGWLHPGQTDDPSTPALVQLRAAYPNGGSDGKGRSVHGDVLFLSFVTTP